MGLLSDFQHYWLPVILLAEKSKLMIDEDVGLPVRLPLTTCHGFRHPYLNPPMLYIATSPPQPQPQHPHYHQHL